MLAIALAELRGKYEEMHALRSIADDGYDPRPRMAALAARFPGALREIDDLPLAEIEQRIDALSRAERDPSTAARWMHAMTRFHALARGILFAKRMLGDYPEGSKGARSPLAEARRASARSAEGELEGEALEQEEWPDEARVWRDDSRVANPPRGRLMDLVYERLARELDTTPVDAKQLVFGAPRRER